MNQAPRRIPQGEEVGALMRFYGYQFTRTGMVKGAERSRTPEDVAAVERFGWSAAVPERWTPAEIIDRSSAAAAALDADGVIGAFVAGFGSAPRGRQIVISYAWARHLDDAPKNADGFAECGLAPTSGAYTVDVTEILLRLALGWAWNEMPQNYLPDLEAAAAEGLPQPTDQDRQRLQELLDIIRAQPDGTRPSELEKAVARAKIIPGTDKYQRYGILIGLAELGVLRSTALDPKWDRFISRSEIWKAYDRVPGSPRSDITLPLAGWRGGINEIRTRLLLNI